MAMDWTIDAPATDTRLRTAWLTLPSNMAGYIRKQGMSQAELWMSWAMDTEQIVKRRITSLQAHTNKLRGMNGARKSNGGAYHIYETATPLK